MRIRTRISQCSNRSLKGERLEFPPLTIDAGTRQASIGNVCVPLTAYEFDILLLLARSPGHVFSPDSIYREIWKLPDLDNTQTVKVHVPVCGIKWKLPARDTASSEPCGSRVPFPAGKQLRVIVRGGEKP